MSVATANAVTPRTSPGLRVTAPPAPACGAESDGTAQASPHRFTITGGPGGTTAHVEDLERAAAALERSAQHLDEAAAYARQLLRLVEQAGTWSPHTAPWAHAAVEPLCSRWGGIAARAERARDTATSLRATAQLYRDTDRRVSDELQRSVVAGHRLGESGPLVMMALGALAVVAGLAVTASVLTVRALRQTPTALGLVMRIADSQTESARHAGGLRGFIARTLGGPGLLPEGFGYPSGSTLELVTPGLAAAILAAAPGRQPLESEPVGPAAGLIGRFAHLGTQVLGTPTHGLVVAPLVTAASPGPWSVARNPAPPRDAADVLGQIATLYPVPTPAGAGAAGGPPGTVGVQRLDHPDGTRSWVVTIPGTEAWGPMAGPNPMDLKTNLDIMAGRPNDVSELVVEAMRSAGIPPDEPVMLAGHSQGGMVAAQIAQDPVVQKQFSIDTVLTAGSPVGTLAGELPPGTLMVSLESGEDLVWGIDGAPNVDDPQRITIRADLADSPRAADRAAALDPVGAHDVRAYARMARDVEPVDDPSVQVLTTRVRRLLGGPGTTASTRFYMGVRVP